MNSGLNQDEPELRILIFAVLRQVLANSDGFLDEPGKRVSYKALAVDVSLLTYRDLQESLARDLGLCQQP